jgi:hypothetical protein
MGTGSDSVPFDPTSNRLLVAYPNIVGARAQVLLTSASNANLSEWTTPQIVAPSGGDRINVEMSIEPTSGRIDLMANDRSWSGNTLFDVTYLWSSDGGQSWSVRRVTKSSWDPASYGVPDHGGVRSRARRRSRDDPRGLADDQTLIRPGRSRDGVVVAFRAHV